LIEESSHKEALSKTFEGLSSQANQISDPGVSAELSARLLFNLIDVSSENPGKLIYDYNKSDHPIMDAMEKSLQLSKSIEKLNFIPGMESLLKKVVAKRENEIRSLSSQASANIEDEGKREDLRSSFVEKT
jgi:hypothetical protein